MSRQRIHYWIYVESYEGRPVLIYGSPNSESEAQRKGFEKLPCPFEVITLPTSDIATASRMVKGRKLDDTQDLGQSLERLRHTF